MLSVKLTDRTATQSTNVQHAVLRKLHPSGLVVRCMLYGRRDTCRRHRIFSLHYRFRLAKQVSAVMKSTDVQCTVRSKFDPTRERERDCSTRIYYEIAAKMLSCVQPEKGVSVMFVDGEDWHTPSEHGVCVHWGPAEVSTWMELGTRMS
jgi:hypothetical protein